MNDFHDWTLLEFRFQWNTGAAALKLRGPDSDEILSFEKVSRIVCSRELEWGYSVSIRKLSSVEILGGTEVRIEMQSGDEILFIGKLNKGQGHPLFSSS